MATAIQTAPEQLIVTLNDASLLNSIKKAISMLRGVEQVKKVRAGKASPIEQSMKDIEEGRVYEAKDLDDLFKQLNS